MSLIIPHPWFYKSNFDSNGPKYDIYEKFNFGYLFFDANISHFTKSPIDRTDSMILRFRVPPLANGTISQGPCNIDRV